MTKEGSNERSQKDASRVTRPHKYSSLTFGVQSMAGDGGGIEAVGPMLIAPAAFNKMLKSRCLS